MRMLRLVLICAVFTVPGFASTLSFNEFNYSGHDLPPNSYPFLGYLDVGINTVSGTIFNWSEGGGPDPDIDTFSLSAVAGTEVISEEINFSFTRNGQNISITEPINGTTNISGDVDTTLTPSTPITGLFNTEIQGTNVGRCTGPGGTPPCTTYVSVPYTITYTVQAIPAAATPEPSSLVLLGTGLAGVAGMLKKRPKALRG